MPGRLVVLLAGCAVLRIVAVAGATPRRYNDSAAYEVLASEPLLSQRFLAGERSWTIPLLYKVLPASDSWRVAGAVAVSVVCWSAFAVVAASFVRTRWLRRAGLTGILLLGLSDPVAQWDPLLLSESVSLSLTVLVLAAWLVLARSPSAAAAASMVAVGVLWIFARDTHAPIALLVCGVVAVPVWRHRPSRRGPWLAAVALIAIAAVCSLASASTDDARPVRVDTPMLHIIGGRVIPDPQAASWFHQRGMPLNPQIRELAPDLGFARAPEPTDQTEPLYRWVRNDGRATYARYLVEHPGPSARAVATRGDDILLPLRIERYRAAGFRTVVPAPVQGVLFHPVALLAPILLGATAAVRPRSRRHLSPALLGVAGTVLLTLVPQAAMAVHGDTIELGRHALEVTVSARLVAALLALAAADALLIRP